MVSLAKLAALNRAMKTPDKMAMELQGLAVTICLGGENRLYSSDRRRGGQENSPFYSVVCKDPATGKQQSKVG